MEFLNFLNLKIKLKRKRDIGFLIKSQVAVSEVRQRRMKMLTNLEHHHLTQSLVQKNNLNNPNNLYHPPPKKASNSKL
jgi:hypothetical protein